MVNNNSAKLTTASKNKKMLETVIGISIFSALAFIVAFLFNIIPPIAGFLSLDAKDAVISIASFIYGPIAGVVISLIAALLEFFTFSTTAWYGLIMNFASSAVFSLTAALIYKFRRNINGALAGLLSAVVMTTIVMLLLNNFVTPIYLEKIVGMPKNSATDMVITLLPKVLLPFNLAKAILNSAISMLLYKPIVMALRKAKIVSGGKASLKFNKSSVIILVIASVAIAASLTILLPIW